MKLEEVLEHISKDSILEKEDYDLSRDTAIKTGSLLSKYMDILSHQRIEAVRLENKKKKLIYMLNGYYKDNLFCDELKRKPSPKIARTNDERDMMVSIDELYVSLIEKIAVSDAIITSCHEFIQYLHYNRTKEIHNFIELTKLYSGRF